MKKFICFVAMVLIASGVWLGCESDKSDTESVRPAAEAVEVKSSETYEKDAEEEITEENAEEELERLKKELETDE
ncbi:MAG: hypothetical protein R6V10_10745 [bacterium]